MGHQNRPHCFMAPLIFITAHCRRVTEHAWPSWAIKGGRPVSWPIMLGSLCRGSTTTALTVGYQDEVRGISSTMTSKGLCTPLKSVASDDRCHVVMVWTSGCQAPDNKQQNTCLWQLNGLYQSRGRAGSAPSPASKTSGSAPSAPGPRVSERLTPPG